MTEVGQQCIVEWLVSHAHDNDAQDTTMANSSFAEDIAHEVLQIVVVVELPASSYVHNIIEGNMGLEAGGVWPLVPPLCTGALGHQRR